MQDFVGLKIGGMVAVFQEADCVWADGWALKRIYDPYVNAQTFTHTNVIFPDTKYPMAYGSEYANQIVRYQSSDLAMLSPCD